MSLTKYTVPASIIFSFMLVGIVGAHTTEIKTFAECKAAGGEISSIQMLSFPVQVQTRCTINEHIYTEGSERIIEVRSDGEAETVSNIPESSQSNPGEGSSDEIRPESPRSEGSAGIDVSVQAQTGINTNLLEVLRERRQSRNAEVSDNEEQKSGFGLESRQQFLEELRARRSVSEKERQEIRENRVNTRVGLQERVRVRVEALTSGLLENLNRKAARLANIADRIESQISLFESEGHSLESESEALAEARVTIEVAKTEIVEAETSLEAMLSSEEPREAFETFKTAVREARDALIASKQELMEVVRSIKLNLSLSAEAEVETQ